MRTNNTPTSYLRNERLQIEKSVHAARRNGKRENREQKLKEI
jgi:hypothetical protein